MRERYILQDALRQGILEVDNLVMLPKNILQELGRTIAPRKNVEYKEIRNRFAMHGYGPKKINNWLQYFVMCEILHENEDGSYTCIWW